VRLGLELVPGQELGLERELGTEREPGPEPEQALELVPALGQELGQHRQVVHSPIPPP